MPISRLLQVFDAPPSGQTFPACPLGWLLRFRANIAVVQSWIPRRSSETRGKTVLFLGKHRVTPCRKQPTAVSCTPGTPRSHARPRLVDRARSCHGTRSRSQERASPSPDHRISRFAPGRIYVVRHPCAAPDPFALRLRGPTRRRPMDRAGPSAPKTGNYVDWDAWLRTRFPTPNPGRPVPTPDPKVTFGASSVKFEATKAADGRHP